MVPKDKKRVTLEWALSTANCRSAFGNEFGPITRDAAELGFSRHRGPQDRAGNSREGQNFFRGTAKNCFSGHPEDNATGFVLSDSDASTSFISRRPSAPSSPMPVNKTPIAFDPAACATDRNRKLTLGRWRETKGPSRTSKK